MSLNPNIKAYIVTQPKGIEENSIIISGVTYKVSDRVAGFSKFDYMPYTAYLDLNLPITICSESEFMIGSIAFFVRFSESYPLMVRGCAYEYHELMLLSSETNHNKTQINLVKNDGNPKTGDTIRRETIIAIPDDLIDHRDIARYCVSMYKLKGFMFEENNNCHTM